MKFLGRMNPLFLLCGMLACFAGKAFATVEYTLHKSDNPTEDASSIPLLSLFLVSSSSPHTIGIA